MEPLKFFELLVIKVPAYHDGVAPFKANLHVLGGNLLSISIQASDLLFLSYHPLDIPFFTIVIWTSTWSQTIVVTISFSSNSSM